MSSMANKGSIACPVCNREFDSHKIEEHVNKCLFLNTQKEANNLKRTGLCISDQPELHRDKKIKLSSTDKISSNKESKASTSTTEKNITKALPLAEQMRPSHLDELIGQVEAFGPNSMLRSLLERKQVPNMILWGPPGCGKTSLANVIATMCKEQSNLRFVKLSATMSGINDVKEVVKVAKNEAQFKRRTVLFMDEIHRFNKLQQDTFLPHVESGTIILIGATTENPSFSLNNALLSRCRVVVMKKLSIENVMTILEKSIKKNKDVLIINDSETKKDCSENYQKPKIMIESASLRWLAEVCDGDARVALSALELALASREPSVDTLLESGPASLTLQDIQDGIKRSHMLFDRGGEEHYNTVSALHKAVRAGHEAAALYWSARALHCGQDPRYVARRLVRAAAEDVGLADPSALVEAVACLQGCQLLGMPECGVLVAQCAVRLARAPKSRAIHDALGRCTRALSTWKGPLPPVPLHLRNAPTPLMKELGYGHGYNLLHHKESGLEYMPEGMEHTNYFDSSSDDSS